jgi:two-component system NtrC family sensor kinase
MTEQYPNVSTTQSTSSLQPEFDYCCATKQIPLAHKTNPIPSSLMTVPGLIYQFLLRKDGSLNFLFLSSSVAEFFELDMIDIELEFDTETLVSLIHPDDQQHFYNSITDAAKLLQSWQWVGRFILASGEQKWVQWDAQPSLQANGNIFWNGLLVDVTSQHKLNAEVERLSFLLGLTERLQTSTELQEIAEFALTYLVQILDCIFGDIQVISGIPHQPQLLKLTHYLANDLISTKTEIAVIQIVAQLQESSPEEQLLIAQIAQTGQPQFLSRQQMPALNNISVSQLGFFPIPASDGTILAVLRLAFRQRSIQYSSQQELLLAACRILGVRLERAKDREYLHQMNAQLQQKTQLLEQTLEEFQQAQTQIIQSEKMLCLGQLVAGMAHELNNSVSFIYGNLPFALQYFQTLINLLQTYQKYYPVPEPEIQSALNIADLHFIQDDLPKLLNSMQTGAKRICSIVDGLKTFSSIENADLKTIDIHKNLDQILLILQHRLQAQPHRPAIQLIKKYADIPLIECYDSQLNQVFMSLLTNAIDALDEKYTIPPDQQGKNQPFSTLIHHSFLAPTLQIRSERVDASNILIGIADNGLGIPEAIKTRLFEPFFTTKPVGKGTGLGLSISYKIITERHQGRLHFLSKPAHGTEFIIEIPLCQSL